MLSLCSLQAQHTYIKRFKSFEDVYEFSNTLVLNKEFIFISSRGDCDGEGCAIVNCLNYNGISKWKMRYPSVYGGNSNSILLQSNTLILGSYESWAHSTYQFHFLPLNIENGIYIDHKKFNYDTISINGVNSEGITQFNEIKLQYGEFRDKNGIASGLVQWIDKENNPIRTTTYSIPGNRTINALQDLQPDGYGNLVFATVLRDDNFVDQIVIRKIDKEGRVIKDVKIPSDDSLEPRPQFAVNNRKEYVFSHKTKRVEEINGVKVVQLVCTDTSGQILWVHNYPWKPSNIPTNVFHTYEINQITPTRDNGVIICASVKTNDFGHGHRNAYIGKFDDKGTLEWERSINFLDDRDKLYDYCSLYDIKERPDGLGYVAVGSYTPSDTSTTSVLLVSMDRDGCIEGLDCDSVRIVVATDDEVDVASDQSIKIYPNPLTNHLTIEFDAVYHLRIHDIEGRTIVNQNIQSRLSFFDTSSWRSGMYIVSLINKDGRSSYKIIKE